MASKESESVRRHWMASRAYLLAPDGPAPEPWDDLTAEPDGVDFVETEAAGLPALWAVPEHGAEDRVLLCVHGGGYISGSNETHRKMFGHLARAAGARALLFEYHYVPEYTFPAQLDETTAVYRWLLDRGVAAEHIAFTGDSVGGNLSISAQLRAREWGLPLPAAAMPFSPAVDQEVTGESFATNRDRDPFFHREFVLDLASRFLAGADPRDPLASPIHADLSGFGPIYIQVGGDETLLDDARMLAEHARAAGVEVRLDVFPEMLHTFQMAAGRAPEADDAIRAMGSWVRPRLGLPALAVEEVS
jgi:epsilon-lactone hydrolase